MANKTKTISVKVDGKPYDAQFNTWAFRNYLDILKKSGISTKQADAFASGVSFTDVHIEVTVRMLLRAGLTGEQIDEMDPLLLSKESKKVKGWCEEAFNAANRAEDAEKNDVPVDTKTMS